MSTADREAAWSRLREASLVEGDLPPPGAHASPWYVRAMLGIAGWIGAWFLLGFIALGLVRVIQSATASIVVGTAFCVAAFAIFRFARENVFATQFALAVSLAGQGLLVFGIAHDVKPDSKGFALTIFALEAALAVAVPNFIHRVMTTWAAMMALWWVLGSYGAWTLVPVIPAVAIAVIWIEESLWVRRASVWTPIGYGLALGMIFMSTMFVWWSYGGMPPGFGPGVPAIISPWVGRLLMGAVLVWAVLRLLQREGTELTSRSAIFAIALALVIAAASIFAPGVASALLLVLLGFASANRILLALGFIALAAFISHYYYRLDSTLLEKSMVLMGLGAGILAARAVLVRLLGPAEAADA